MQYVPVIRFIRETIDSDSDNSVSEDFFITMLEKYFSEQAAEEVMKVAIESCACCRARVKLSVLEAGTAPFMPLLRPVGVRSQKTQG